MHPAVEEYLALPPEQQKTVQLRLCERVLDIWDHLMPSPVVYKNKTTGTLHLLEVGLLREAFLSVKIGKDRYQIQQRFMKPMSDLQSGILVLPGKTKFAYFAIRNLFATYILQDQNDPWLVPNQALAAMEESDVIPNLEWAMSSLA